MILSFNSPYRTMNINTCDKYNIDDLVLEKPAKVTMNL